MLNELVYIDNPYWIYLLKYLDIHSIITLVVSNKDMYLITKNDCFWKYLGIIYKCPFFWELASMRSEINYIMLCDKSIGMRQEIINVYRFDKYHKQVKNLNELYYYMWIQLENNINKENSYIMQNKLFQYYNLFNPFENHNGANYNDALFIIRQKIFNKKFINH